MAKEVIKDLVEKVPNRRKFVRNLGIASAALGVASVVDPAKSEAQAAFTDVDILNFALHLEYLEAEFYTVATTGLTIDKFQVAITGGSGASGATTGGAMVPFSTTDITVQRVAQELAQDERTHVSLIQNAIMAAGGMYNNKPAINLDALSSLGVGYTSEIAFLQLSRIFEDIGVTAYGGAAPLLTSATVGTAARILATEALHVGNIRYLLTRAGASSGAVLDGVDVPTPSNVMPMGTKYFSTNANAITQIRTPGQVLALAFGGPNLTKGGFFPSGVNANPALVSMSSALATDPGVAFFASPNPIPLTGGSAYGQTTISWNAPMPPTQYIQIRVGSPQGPLFTTNFNSGSMMTNVWVTEGLVLYLQDISNGKALTAQNTIGTLILRTYASA